MNNNDVRDAIVRSLILEFPNSKVYGEQIKQGLQPGSFFVHVVTGQHSKLLGPRYNRSLSFDVRYFGRSNEERHEVAEALYEALEYITAAGNLLRGTDMRHEVIDDVLHFFVDYDFHLLRKKAPLPKMRSMRQEGRIKNG
ncbi:phage tail terminator family protein [Paenibacillus chitinolyticus]